MADFNYDTVITNSGLSIRQCAEVLCEVVPQTDNVMVKIGPYVIKRADDGSIVWCKEYIKNYDGSTLAYISGSGTYFAPGDDLSQITSIKIFDCNWANVSAHLDLHQNKLTIYPNWIGKDEFHINLKPYMKDGIITTSDIFVEGIPVYWYIVMRYLIKNERVIDFLKDNKQMLGIGKSLPDIINEKRFNYDITNEELMEAMLAYHKKCNITAINFFRNNPNERKANYCKLTDTLTVKLEEGKSISVLDNLMAVDLNETLTLVPNANIENMLYWECGDGEVVYKFIISRLIRDIISNGFSMQRCEMLRIFASFL